MKGYAGKEFYHSGNKATHEEAVTVEAKVDVVMFTEALVTEVPDTTNEQLTMMNLAQQTWMKMMTTTKKRQLSICYEYNK